MNIDDLERRDRDFVDRAEKSPSVHKTKRLGRFKNWCPHCMEYRPENHKQPCGRANESRA